MEQTQHDPQRMSTLYQYHNAPEVAPAHGLEYDDTKYSSSSDKYPVIHSRPFDPVPASKVPYNRNRPPRIIFGMKVRTFFIVAAVIVCILVGAAVGGAVGGRSMRENHAEKNVWPANGEDGNSTEASSPPSLILSASPSVYSAPVPTYTPLSPCPDANNTEYTSAFADGRDGSVPATAGLNFTKYCDVESPLSSLPDASTLSEVFVYSFDDCVEVCASLNFWAGDRNCSVAVYDAKGNRPGNCWVGSVDGLEIGNLGEKDGMGMAVLRGD